MEKSGRIKLKAFIDKHFDLELFQELGWIAHNKKRIPYVAMSKKICRFFGFETVYDYGRFKHEGAWICLGGEDDASGMKPAGTKVIKPTIDYNNPLDWNQLIPPDIIDMQLEDRFLN